MNVVDLITGRVQPHLTHRTLPSPIAEFGPEVWEMKCNYCPHPLAWHTRELAVVEFRRGRKVVQEVVTDRITRCNGCAMDFDIDLGIHGAVAPSCLIISIGKRER